MINDTDTKIIVESVLRSSELKKIQENIERIQHIMRSEIILDKPTELLRHGQQNKILDKKTKFEISR